MKLLQTTLLNGISVIIKVINSFLLNKILAMYIGPSGYAVIGQFQNFIQLIVNFAGGLINTAVVKYTAEYSTDPSAQQNIWRNAGTLVLILSLLFSFLIVIFQKPLSNYIFHSTEYQSVFMWFGIFLIFFNFNALFLAILNGKKEILKLVIANIIGSIFSLLITGYLAYQYHTLGALIALSIYQSIAFFTTLMLCKKSDWFQFKYLFGELDKEVIIKFGQYALMALVGSLCLPLSQLAIRYILIKELGVTYAGYWEAMSRLSGGYLMLATTTLSVYYIPRMSELKDYDEIKNELLLGYKFILPLAIFCGLIVYILKDGIIKLLYTESFLPMKELFLWQISGDILKVGSWIIVYLMTGKAMTRLFVTTEIVFTTLLIILTYFFIDLFGFKGVSIAYMVNYAVYWAVISKSILANLREG